MPPSEEVQDATGEAPSAAEQLGVKRVELDDARRQLVAAELAGDVRRTIALEDEIDVLHRIIEKLRAKAAIEAASEARDEAVELRAKLQKRYTVALEALAPNLEQARRAIQAAATAARECSTTWAAASRLKYELDVLAMRFNLGGVEVDVLPVAPVAALTEMFGDELERTARLSIRQPLPVYSSSASDSREQIAANKMAAAHEAVKTVGADLKLSNELCALFTKAGAPELRVPQSVSSDSAFIGTDPPKLPLPGGAVESALRGYGMPTVAPSEQEQEETARDRRGATRKKAREVRELGEEAQRTLREAALREGSSGLRE